jgi:hypothetical protein
MRRDGRRRRRHSQSAAWARILEAAQRSRSDGVGSGSSWLPAALAPASRVTSLAAEAAGPGSNGAPAAAVAAASSITLVGVSAAAHTGGGGPLPSSSEGEGKPAAPPRVRLPKLVGVTSLGVAAGAPVSQLPGDGWDRCCCCCCCGGGGGGGVRCAGGGCIAGLVALPPSPSPAPPGVPNEGRETARGDQRPGLGVASRLEAPPEASGPPVNCRKGEPPRDDCGVKGDSSGCESSVAPLSLRPPVVSEGEGPMPDRSERLYGRYRCGDGVKESQRRAEEAATPGFDAAAAHPSSVKLLGVFMTL